MRAIRLAFLVLLTCSPLLLSGVQALGGARTPERPPAGGAVVLNVSGAIGPATADFIHRGLQKAHERNAAVVVLKLDTPGGLDTSMRTIIQDILASPVPVVTYVAPAGARAASAGTYILIASHVAAMAPGTNVGAATPVRIGGVPDPGRERPVPTGKEAEKGKDKEADKKPAPAKPGMDEKALNDAIAYIRGLAQMRGRNAVWAEKAVREAASLPAEEAVKQNVADLVASDVANLLAKLDGRRVSMNGREVTLKTKGLEIVVIEPDWRSRLLSVITDPNIAYILMLLGIYGLFFELWNPGFLLPGVLGAICLLLALYAFQVLPISYAGLGLILLGIAFMVAEAFAPSFGVLGIGGVIAFTFGSIILFDTDAPGFEVAWPLILGVALTSALFFFGVVYLAVRARRRAVVSGSEEMVGLSAEALEDFQPDPGQPGMYFGRVRVHSEEWQARASGPVARGTRLRVQARLGLILEVATDTGGHTP